MRSQIPSFRLPGQVLDEVVDRVLNTGMSLRFNQRVESMEQLLAKDDDALFVGAGVPRGKDLDLPGRAAADDNVHIGIDWLQRVAFEHTDSIGKKVVVLSGGNTAMDCCRTAPRVGGEPVTITVRSTFESMKASPWENEGATRKAFPSCPITPPNGINFKGKEFSQFMPTVNPLN